jgi:hypothetical protein
MTYYDQSSRGQNKTHRCHLSSAIVLPNKAMMELISTEHVCLTRKQLRYPKPRLLMTWTFCFASSVCLAASSYPLIHLFHMTCYNPSPRGQSKSYGYALASVKVSTVYIAQRGEMEPMTFKWAYIIIAFEYASDIIRTKRPKD